ncbi:hypothetical protein [Streptomyces sp. NPDC048612]|uniref:hypothetical protein n=1 Tax=Streptomyces sp. NPDC048612 TaxID=3365579 RepID=UPI0037103774
MTRKETPVPDESEKQINESEFEEVTKDPAAARALRKSLETLAGGGAGDTLKEMAREVLSGRIGIREAVNVPAYSEALIANTQSARDEWTAMSDSERESRADEGERYLEEQRNEIEEECRSRPLGGKSSQRKPRHSGSEWSLH